MQPTDAHKLIRLQLQCRVYKSRLTSQTLECPLRVRAVLVYICPFVTHDTLIHMSERYLRPLLSVVLFIAIIAGPVSFGPTSEDTHHLLPKLFTFLNQSVNRLISFHHFLIFIHKVRHFLLLTQSVNKVCVIEEWA